MKRRSHSLRSKRFLAVSEQRTRNGIFGLGRAKNEREEKTALSFHFSPGQNQNSRSSSFLGHFALLRNHTETLAAQTKEIRATSLQASSLGAGAQGFGQKACSKVYQKNCGRFARK